jgi:hypothetical protein
MTKPPIPDDVRRFVLTSIPSVPFLEAMLLLRSDAARSWDAAGAARRLYVGEAQSLALLHALSDAGIATVDGVGYRYAPASQGLREAIDALAHTYSVNLMGVTELIHSRIDKRALQLADAFRWTKKKEN